MTTPQVFVDDTDPQVTYSGSWTQLQGLTNAHFSGSSRTINPLYGTVHTSGTDSGSYSLSYSFSGTAFTAVFHTQKASFTCTLDGSVQAITPTDSGVLCSNTEALSPGSHNLVITLDDNSISLPFDGVYYTPVTPPVSDADISYDGNNQIIQKTFVNPQYMQAFGDTLEVDFVGHALALYANFFDGSVQGSPVPHNSAPSFLTYTLDGGSPVNFTVSNPTSASNPNITSQLVVQTPRYPNAGAHRFSMTLTGAAGADNVVIMLNSVIVQNASLPVVPDANPQAPAFSTQTSSSGTSSTPAGTPSTTSEPGKSLHKNVSVVVPAVLVPVLVVVIIIVIFLYLRRRNRIPEDFDVDPSPDRMAEVEPFQVTHQASPGTRGSISKLSPLRHPSAPNNHDDNHRPLRYRIHSDGGVVVNPSDYDEESNTVDLPPLYGDFKTSPSNSSTTGPTTLSLPSEPSGSTSIGSISRLTPQRRKIPSPV
ncbi:hypothetical protein CPC08DRAFT_706731 [Agrocybe pediades]|nr:hypothetical protein CPC08DRAFT_706731 [Agrocybe pediades]